MLETEKFGRYQLLERLGKGGMGEVYLAKHSGPMGVTRFVALKRVLGDKLEPEELETGSRLGKMFVDEMRLAVRLTHPNIIAVYDFGLEGGSYYLAMEFVGGVDVHQLLKRGVMRGLDRLDNACVLYAVGQIARGLDYVHKLTDGRGTALNVVHRDVTPANILLSFNGDVKLADFGVARATQAARQTRTETGELKGKIRYMSPEQARGEKVDSRSDLFSLGTVLLEMLTLRPAFHGESEIQSLMQVQSGRPADWAERLPKIPEDVLPILEKAMARDREDRFPDGAAFAEQLEVALRRRDPGFGPAKLGAYMVGLFGKEKSALQERMGKYEAGFDDEQVSLVVSVSSAGNLGKGKVEGGPGADDPTSVGTPTNLKLPPPEPVPALTSTSSSGTPPPTSTTQVSQAGVIGQGRRGPGPMVVALGVAVLGIVGVGVWALRGQQSSGVQPVAVQPIAPQPVAPQPVVPQPVAPVAVQPVAPVAVQPVTPAPVVPQPVAVPPVAPKPGGTGRILLNTNTIGTKVFLDKSSAEPSPSPIAAGGTTFKIDIPASSAWVLRIEAEGFKTLNVPIKLNPGEETSIPVALSPSTPGRTGDKPTKKRDPVRTAPTAATTPTAPATHPTAPEKKPDPATNPLLDY